MKKILVSGGAGFIGSHLCTRLINDGHQVICLDNLFTGSEGNITHLKSNPRFEFVLHDVETPYEADVDEIYNLACPASPIHYQYDAIKTIKTSVLGAINMLGLAKKTNAKILQASTSEVYGDPVIHPQVESYWGNVNPIGVRACYDEGKRAAEALIYDYIRQYDVDVRVVRIFNTYGPKMNPLDGRIISNFIMQALSNDDITIYGNGKQTRSFCFIDDTVNCLIKLMNLDHKNETPINVGNPYELSVGYVAEFIKERIGSSSQIVYLNEMSDDPKKRKPNISKAKKIIDWEPCVSFEDGIDATIDYFKNIE